MKVRLSLRVAGTVVLAVMILLTLGCAEKSSDNSGKIPITSSSKVAREAFLKGRDLQERLQGQESLAYFDEAIAADPELALAYYYASLGQPTAKDFFDKLNSAVALVDKVSEGERLWILGFEAGVNGDPKKQYEYFQKLVTTYPGDERAHSQLGNYYFGQQQWDKAIAAYKKAVAINPNYSQSYNQLGYSLRALSKYDEAEQAFKKYIELIPNDPNPYDSYAELLLKVGRFEESIEQYRLALSHNPNFVASYIGIATNLCLLNKHEEARTQLKQLYNVARNDGERRAALFAATVTFADEGKWDQALQEMQQQYALAAQINDSGNLSGDLNTMGNILLESGKPEQALQKYEESLAVVEQSELSPEIKANAKRGHLFNVGRVALAKGEVATAKSKTEEFLAAAEATHNTFQIWQAHELAGAIALAEKDFAGAADHLGRANQQNPYTHYRLAKAYAGLGENTKAQQACKKAAHFNGINSLNYAFVRAKAAKLLTKLES